MILAIDIGGTKTLLAVFDPSGALLETNKFPSNNDYRVFKEDLAENLQKLTNKTYQICCVGRPGTIVRNSSKATAFGNLAWSNVSLTEDLEKMLRCPILEENDANLAGLSEAKSYGESKDSTLYVTISTGIGGGYIVDGKIYQNMIDAEVGAMIFERDDKLVRWEDIASGKSIVAKYGKRASEISDPVVWSEIAYNIAIGLYNIIRIITPSLIIIGGGVGAHFEKFKEPLIQHLEKIKPGYVWPEIIQAKHAEEAVIYGCYYLAKENIQSRK